MLSTSKPFRNNRTVILIEMAAGPFLTDDMEIFGGEEAFNKVVRTIKEKILDPLEDEECLHDTVETFPDGKGQCIECGRHFEDVNDIKHSGRCPHLSTFEAENGLHICYDCGEEMEILDFDPEWRFYWSSDNRSARDPSRCHRSRTSNRGLQKTFTDIGLKLPGAVLADVEVRYNKVVGGRTVRGKGRRAIIAACLFFSYQKFGEYRTTDFIAELFELERGDMSTGLNEYYDAFVEDRTKEVRPEDLLKWILRLTGVGSSHYRKIVHIARYLENSSRLVKRSSPQSVASAIVYFYLCLNPEYKEKMGMTKSKFSERALLSDITVTKLVRDIVATTGCAVDV